MLRCIFGTTTVQPHPPGYTFSMFDAALTYTRIIPKNSTHNLIFREFGCLYVCVYLQIFPISLAIRRRALKHFLPCACQMAFSECVNWRDETPSKATHRSQMKMLKRRLKQHVTGARASQRVAAPVKQSHKLCRNWMLCLLCVCMDHACRGVQCGARVERVMRKHNLARRDA